MTPALTVCVPAYNQPEFLRDALNSLCDQGLHRDQYLVAISDDASPTPLDGVVDSFRDRLQIVYCRHAANVGHLRNFEHTLSMSATPFVSFLPHDDLVTPGHLGRALRAIVNAPQCGLIASLILCQRFPGSLDTQPHGIFPQGAERSRFGEPYRWLAAEWMALGLITTPLSMVGSIFRREVFAKCRQWLSFPLWHDRLMLAEMGLHADVISLPWIGGHYRVSANQLSGQLWQNQREEFLSASLAILAACRAAGVGVEEFWIDRICTADRADRLTYLQLLSAALPSGDYDRIKSACEARLQVRLHTSRLDRLGLPRPVAAAVRSLNQFLGSRLG
jgi:glycosyltransferase involved in cell wall biosynthesis